MTAMTFRVLNSKNPVLLSSIIHIWALDDHNIKGMDGSTWLINSSSQG